MAIHYRRFRKFDMAKLNSVHNIADVENLVPQIEMSM